MNDTIAIIEYDLKFGFRLDSIEKLHTYYGDNYESRFLTPEINATIRMALSEVKIDSFNSNLFKEGFNNSKINNLFELKVSLFKLKSENGYYDSLAKARKSK